jgi:hypothetical protein
VRTYPAKKFVELSLSASACPGDLDACRQAIHNGKVSWEKVAHLSAQELVAPAMYSGLKRQGLWGELPVGFTDYLESLHYLNTLRNQEVLEEIALISGLFERAGIESVALKGAAYLLLGLYKDPGDRVLTDIDLLVSETESKDALRILKEAGFAYCGWSTSLHFERIARPNSAVGVEIHRGLDDDIWLDPSAVLGAARTGLSGFPLKVPCPDHMIVHHVIHYLHHARVNYRWIIWPRLRFLYDLVQLNSKFGDQNIWGNLWKYFEDIHLEGVLWGFISSAQHVLKMSWPAGIPAQPPDPSEWKPSFRLLEHPRLRLMNPGYLAGALGPKIDRYLRREGIPMDPRRRWRNIVKIAASPGLYCAIIRCIRSL